MQKVLVIIANTYIGLFIVFWLYAMFNIFLSRGFAGVQETLNPFNVANLIVTLIFLSPYLILVTIIDKMGTKKTAINKD